MKKKDPNRSDTVAAEYLCDFGYIVLGHSKKQKIVMNNIFEDPVQFDINRRLLAEYGFKIEPLSTKPVLMRLGLMRLDSSSGILPVFRRRAALQQLTSAAHDLSLFTAQRFPRTKRAR